MARKDVYPEKRARQPPKTLQATIVAYRERSCIILLNVAARQAANFVDGTPLEVEIGAKTFEPASRLFLCPRDSGSGLHRRVIFVMRQAETILGNKISPSFGARKGQHQIRRHSKMRIRDRADRSFMTHEMARHGLHCQQNTFIDGCELTSLGLGSFGPNISCP